MSVQQNMRRRTCAGSAATCAPTLKAAFRARVTMVTSWLTTCERAKILTNVRLGHVITAVSTQRVPFTARVAMDTALEITITRAMTLTSVTAAPVSISALTRLEVIAALVKITTNCRVIGFHVQVSSDILPDRIEVFPNKSYELASWCHLDLRTNIRRVVFCNRLSKGSHIASSPHAALV